MYIRKKHLIDLLLYFQKNYGLFYVEYRVSQNRKPSIVLSKPDEQKNWWIYISFSKLCTVHVIVACAGDADQYRDQIRKDLLEGKFKSYGEKYKGKFLDI